jgi:hypothetical protein
MITCPVSNHLSIATVDNPLHLVLERCEGFSFTNKLYQFCGELVELDPALTVSNTDEQ